MNNLLKKVAVSLSTVATVASMGLMPFAANAASPGEVYKTTDGTVWFITSDMQKRPFTSAGAFLSYGFLSFSQVKDADASVTALPTGSFIAPADGKIFCASETKGSDVKGECSLVTGGMKAAFTSAAVFTGQGYSFSRAINGDSSFLSKTSNIDNASAGHLAGTLVNNGGTVQMVVSGGLWGVPSMDVFNSWGYSFSDVVPANTADKALAQVGVIPARQAGQLVPTGTTNPGPTSGFNASVASNTPASMVIAGGSSYNSMLVINLNNASGATATVTGIKATKSGFLANTNVTGVSAFDSNGTRHGNVVTTLGADGVANLTFGANPIIVNAGQSTSVTIKANISSSATSGTVGFGINSASDITLASGSIGGTFPLMGNAMTIVSGSSSLAGVTVDVQPVSGSGGTTLNVDTVSEQDITKFRVGETTSNEDVTINSITLFNGGTASDSDVQDLQLVNQLGTVVATAQQVNKYVTFNLSPVFTLAKGQSKDFTVRAKIINGAGRTIQYTIYNDYDVVVMGSTTHSGILPTAAGGVDSTFPIGDTSSTYNRVTVGSGSLSLTKASDSPSAAVSPAANNVVLAKFNAKATGENMEVRGASFGFDFESVDAFGDLTGTVYLKMDGATIFSAAANGTNFVDETYSARTLSTYPVLNAGQTHVFTIEASLSSSATAGHTLKVGGFDITSVKRLVTGDTVDPTVGTVAGNLINIQGAQLNVTTLATPVAASVVNGQSNVTLANIELNAGASGEDARVTSITVTDTKADGSGTSAYTDITNLVMYDSLGNALATTSSTSTNANTVAFNLSTPLMVSKTSPTTLTLKGDFITTVAGIGSTHTFKVASTNVTAYGKDTGNQISGGNLVMAGTGQTMTIASAGTLVGSLVSGSSATPNTPQNVRIGAADGVYLKVRLSAQNEAMKISTFILKAAGTSLNQNDIRNVRLYENDSTTPFATASQMASCAANACSNTWTASDNLLAAAIPAGGSTTITVKADIGAENISKLGDDFYMKLNVDGTDTIAKGVTSGSAPSYSGGNLNNGTSNKTRLVPFSVLATGEYPTSGVTTTVVAGTTIGRFKVANNGSAQVTITNFKVTDAGSHTNTTSRYKLYSSSQNSSDYLANDLGASTTDFASSVYEWTSLTTTIDGGSYRYFSVAVSTLGGLIAGDSYNLSVAALGDIKYSVLESALGYDAEQDGDITGTITGLYNDGKPQTAVITKQ